MALSSSPRQSSGLRPPPPPSTTKLSQARPAPSCPLSCLQSSTDKVCGQPHGHPLSSAAQVQEPQDLPQVTKASLPQSACDREHPLSPCPAQESVELHKLDHHRPPLSRP